MAEGGEVHVGPYGVGIGQPHQTRGHPKVHIHLRLRGAGVKELNRPLYPIGRRKLVLFRDWWRGLSNIERGQRSILEDFFHDIIFAS